MRMHSTLCWSIKASTQGMMRIFGQVSVVSLTYTRTSGTVPAQPFAVAAKDSNFFKWSFDSFR